MIAFAAPLFWLNNLFVRVIGPPPTLDESGERQQIQGPLELLLGWSLGAAVVVAVVWLFLHPIPQLSGGIG
jgi:Na+/H+ antiporter NhaD/arsenite permease-like protein